MKMKMNQKAGKQKSGSCGKVATFYYEVYDVKYAIHDMKNMIYDMLRRREH